MFLRGTGSMTISGKEMLTFVRKSQVRKKEPLKSWLHKLQHHVMPQGGAADSRAQAGNSGVMGPLNHPPYFLKHKEDLQSKIMANSKTIKSASWSSLLLSAGGNPKSAPHLAFHGKCVFIVHGKEPRGHSEQDADSHLRRHTDCTKKMDFILSDEGSGGPQGVAD